MGVTLVSSMFLVLWACSPAGAVNLRTERFIGGGTPLCDTKNRLTTAADLEKNWTKLGFRQKVIDHFHGLEQVPVLTIGDFHTTHFFKNFVAHAQKVTDNVNASTGIGERSKLNITHVCVDETTYGVCQEVSEKVAASSWGLKVECVDLSGFIPMEMHEKHHHLNPGSCAFAVLSWLRPFVLKAAVTGSRKGVFMTDTDVVLHKNPMGLIEKALRLDKAAEIYTGEDKRGPVNTGTVYSTKWGIEVVSGWCKMLPMYAMNKIPDQSALRYKYFYGEGVKRLIGTFEQQDLGQCGVKGYWGTHYGCDRDIGEHALKHASEWDPKVDATPIMPGVNDSKLNYYEEPEARALAIEREGMETNHLAQTVDRMKEAGVWLVEDE